MAKPRRMLWYAVDVDARQNEKVVELPSDTARYGWFLAVLAEAKRQKRQGQFRSRAHLGELIGRFARFVPNYRAAGLLEEAPKLCDRCRTDFGDLPAGALVVHDWWQKQRDPLRAERAEAWRASNADQTPIERPLNATSETTQERLISVRSGATPPRARDVRAQDRESRVESQKVVEREVLPSAPATPPNGVAAGASFFSIDPGDERHPVAALLSKRFRYREVTGPQWDRLFEIVVNEFPIGTKAGADRHAAWQWLAELMKALPRDAGDPIEAAFGEVNRRIAERKATTDAEEAAWQELKNAPAGPIAAEMAGRIGPKPTNGTPRMSRDDEIEYLRSVRGTLDAALWSDLLARRGFTEEDLEDPVDFTPPPPEESAHA